MKEASKAQGFIGPIQGRRVGMAASDEHYAVATLGPSDGASVHALVAVQVVNYA